MISYLTMTVLAACANDVDKPIHVTLQRRVSFSVAAESLEGTFTAFAVKIRQDDPEFAIKVLADDLKLEGITRNQAIRDLKLENRSVAEILTAIVMKANPIPDLKSPADPQLKLIWVVGSDPSDVQRRMVLITTRAAARKRGAQLPDAFRGPE